MPDPSSFGIVPGGAATIVIVGILAVIYAVKVHREKRGR